jgi:hypothetical protein
MERSNFFGDQLVTDVDLNNIETTTASQIVLREQASLNTSGGMGKGIGGVYVYPTDKGGVFGSAVDYLNTSKNLYPDPASSVQIIVAAGQALDGAGNFINVTTPQTINKGDTGDNSWASTPLVYNYVKIRYRETSDSVGANDAGDQFYTRYYDSFSIIIDGNAPVIGTDVILGQFMSDSGGAITVIQDCRTYVRTNVPADSVFMDPTVTPVATFHTVEDHVAAVGTGTPSITNPHGLTGADIGVTDPLIGVIQHRQDSHVNGIVVGDTSFIGTLQSYSASIVSNTPVLGTDSLVFTNPANAALIVDGNVLTTPLNSIVSDSAPSTGDMWVVYDKTLAAAYFVPVADLIFDPSNPRATEQYVLLASASVDPVTHSITNVADLRTFNAMSQYDIQTDYNETVSTASVLSRETTTHINSLVDNLARMRAQIGVALNGTASVWEPGSPSPLTVGATSNADPFHTHASLATSAAVSAAISQLDTTIHDITSGSITFPAVGSSTSIKSLANQFSDFAAYWRDGSDVGIPSGLRPGNTVIHNTTGRTLFVNISVSIFGANGQVNQAQIQVSSDPAFATWRVVSQAAAGTVPDGGSFSNIIPLIAFIPPDYYYKLEWTSGGGSATVAPYQWIEQS